MTEGRRITAYEDVRAFIFAGNARFTLVSGKTGKRFTFRVRKGKEPGAPFFVSVLTGPDNEQSFTYLGFMHDDGKYMHGVRSKIAPNGPSATAIRWFLQQIQKQTLPEEVEFWHEGRCGRCGRALTVPSSIERGLGPECAGKEAAASGGQNVIPFTRSA